MSDRRRSTWYLGLGLALALLIAVAALWSPGAVSVFRPALGENTETQQSNGPLTTRVLPILEPGAPNNSPCGAGGGDAKAKTTGTIEIRVGDDVPVELKPFGYFFKDERGNTSTHEVGPGNLLRVEVFRVPSTWNIAPLGPFAAYFAPATVEVADAGVYSVLFSLPAKTSLLGRVLECDGSPASSATVYFQKNKRETPTGPIVSSWAVASAVTAHNGTYLLFNQGALPGGSPKFLGEGVLTAEKQVDNTLWIAAADMTAPADKLATCPDLRLGDGFDLTVDVMLSGVRYNGRAKVSIAIGTVLDFTIEGTGGQFQFRGIPDYWDRVRESFPSTRWLYIFVSLHDEKSASGIGCPSSRVIVKDLHAQRGPVVVDVQP